MTLSSTDTLALATRWISMRIFQIQMTQRERRFYLDYFVALECFKSLRVSCGIVSFVFKWLMVTPWPLVIMTLFSARWFTLVSDRHSLYATQHQGGIESGEICYGMGC